MKLYMSLGYIDEEGKSNRLFHLEQPVDDVAVGKLVEFVKDQWRDLIG